MSVPMAEVDFAKIVDTHTWNDSEGSICTSHRKEVRHGDTCTVCGLKRLGPFAEQLNWHFFTYPIPGTEAHTEVVPPCNPEVVAARGVEVFKTIACRSCGNDIKDDGRCRICGSNETVEILFCQKS